MIQGPLEDISTPTCPVCKGTVLTPVLNKSGYDLVRCTLCDTVHVSPIPSDRFLQDYYQEPDYFSGDSDQGYQNYADMKKALRPHFRRRLNTINSFLPTGGRLLDFGCAAGYFLEMARADGWQIAGVELAGGMAQRAAQNLQIPIPPSLAELPEKQFDVITLWEVIEHLPRPAEQLRELHDALQPGGVLMLSTPNTGHWQAIREPHAWVGYRPPAHLIFFTARTLETALHRAGFEHITTFKVAPLPPLPGWLRRMSAPLQQGLVTGQARLWLPALLTWRVVRLLGWGWQRLFQPDTDIFATLEAMAFRPL